MREDRLLINSLKVGQVVFLRTRIIEGPNDYSPGGIYGHRGDAVVIKSIRAFGDPFSKSNGPDGEFCTINWRYSVRHPDVKDGIGFYVSRHEIMPTDPLVTILEQREYLQSRGRYKTLDERFKTGELQ